MQVWTGQSFSIFVLSILCLSIESILWPLRFFSITLFPALTRFSLCWKTAETAKFKVHRWLKWVSRRCELGATIMMTVQGGCHYHRWPQVNQFFMALDCWPRWFLGLWPLTVLNFNHWPLTMCTFAEVYGRMHSNFTPSLVYGVKMCGHSCDYWVYGSAPPPLWFLSRSTVLLWRSCVTIPVLPTSTLTSSTHRNTQGKISILFLTSRYYNLWVLPAAISNCLRIPLVNIIKWPNFLFQSSHFGSQQVKHPPGASVLQQLLWRWLQRL